MSSHCLLIVLNQGLVLVDSGFSSADVSHPHGQLTRLMLATTRPVLKHHETALAQIESLGFQAADVRHIVLTHMDIDHISGITDFPDAQIHVYLEEYAAATALKKHGAYNRYRYRQIQWSRQAKWNFYKLSGEKWHGFDACRELRGLPAEIFAIPLLGHSVGHCGIVVSDSQKTLLHAGDAFFNDVELSDPHSLHAVQMQTLQYYLASDYKKQTANIQRLSELRQQRSDIEIFCSHDIDRFKVLKNKSLRFLDEGFSK